MHCKPSSLFAILERSTIIVIHIYRYVKNSCLPLVVASACGVTNHLNQPTDQRDEYTVTSRILIPEILPIVRAIEIRIVIFQ